MDDLPTDYDVIVVGTGMPGSIVAAALSRIGKSVLHIDANDFYGEEWASFNLETMETGVLSSDVPDDPPRDVTKFLKPNENYTPITVTKRCSKICQKWHCQSKTAVTVPSDASDVEPETENLGSASLPKEMDKEEWTIESVKKEYRKFNLDLCPKMLYSRGDLVELLISSNIARYAEFKSVSRVLTWRQNCLEVVPCSRADVFATKHVSVVQKRMLVKILTLFAEYPACKEEFEGFANKTFVEYLKHKKLPDQLIHYILYAIAMSTDTTPCLEGVESCQKFLKSLGRYGNTPFIFPLYGSGELPQCFCRLCAVFGGVYHLKRPVNGIILAEDGSAAAIVSGNQRLSCKQLVLSSSYCPSHFLASDSKPALLRAIFVTDRSLVESEKEAITLLQFPPCVYHDKPVTIMEMGHSCHVAPEGLFLVHMTSEASQTKEMSGLKHVKDTLLRDFESKEEGDREMPRIIWSLEWEMVRGNDVTTTDCPSNVKVYSGPDPGIDFDDSVKQAREIFAALCPEEEFLPRAPDPEEIVTDDHPADPSETETQSECEANTDKGENKGRETSVESLENPIEQQGVKTAEATVEPVKDKIEEQGLTTAEATVESVKDKIEEQGLKTAEATVESVKDKIEEQGLIAVETTVKSQDHLRLRDTDVSQYTSETTVLSHDNLREE